MNTYVVTIEGTKPSGIQCACPTREGALSAMKKIEEERIKDEEHKGYVSIWEVPVISTPQEISKLESYNSLSNEVSDSPQGREASVFYPTQKDQRWKKIPTSFPDTPSTYKWNIVPYSECAMHIRAAGKPIDSVILTENGRYAYVLTKDGQVYDGLPSELMVPILREWAEENAKAKEEIESKVASMLDKVADSLETKGFLKEAEEIDVLSNTVEAAGLRNPFSKGKSTEEGSWGEDPIKAILNFKKALKILGWQGGTIHQVAEQTGLTVKQIHEANDIERLIKEALREKASDILRHLPSRRLLDYEEAATIIDEERRKNPQGLKSIIKDIFDALRGTIKENPMVGLEANEKNTVGSFSDGANKLSKKYSDPERQGILMAVLSLLAKSGTVNAPRPQGAGLP